jgi:hypothetical protein
MKCRDVEKLLIDYLDKNLSDEICLEVEHHLNLCERCLDDARDMKELFKLMAENKNVIPDDSLRLNFYHMLNSEIIQSTSISKDATKYNKNKEVGWYRNQWYRIAAGIAILISGTFLGMFTHSKIINSHEDNEMVRLKSEISNLKKITMMTMLQQESASDRIQALRYVEELNSPDQDVIGVLVNTLHSDRNVNVKVAAAYALEKYADNPSVCDSLVLSLALQTDPIVQVALINILAERKVKSALVPIQRIIRNEITLKEVRVVAENSLLALI